MDTLPRPGKQVLIVDDDEFLRNVYTAKLKDEGFTVTAASDGQEAWEIIQKGYLPAVVFTGILMPRMTGFDLIRKMQADPKLASIPVAISSHRNRPEDREMAQTLKVDDFIVRGLVPLNEVVRRIRLLLGTGQAYVIELQRGSRDSESLVQFFDKQNLTFFANNPQKKLLLKLEPQEEKGSFKVGAEEDMTGK